MALFNSFTFGDVDSEDYGVYISGDSVYDSPARSVDLVQVPGRNGALALDNGYYENIEVTYPAGSFGTSQTEWREKMLGIRNALAAQRGYQKLIDTYHPEHYRLGMFFAGISATPVQYNRAGQFPIRFNCKPQRFLISGDTPVEFTAEGQEEVYGPSSIASFEAEEGAEIRQLEVDLEPVQDLNDYDNPWPAGGGKNLLDYTNIRSAATDVGIQCDASGNISDSSPTGDGRIFGYSACNWQISLAAGTYTVSWYVSTAPTNSNANLLIYQEDGTVLYNGSGLTVLSVGTHSKTITLSAATSIGIICKIYDGKYKIQIESGSTATSWQPYSNICPISGHTEVNVYRAGKNLIWRDATSNIYNGGNLIPVTAGETLYFYGEWTGGSFIPRIYSNPNETNKNNYIASLAMLSTSASGSVATCVVSVDGFLGVAYNGSVASYTVEKLMVSRTPITSADDYEAPQIATYPISFGQTVYGGTLDVVSGVLTVKSKLYIPNGTGSVSSGMSFNKDGATDHNVYYAISSANTPLVSNQTIGGANTEYTYCSHYPLGNSSTDNTYYVTSGQIRICLPVSDERDTAAKFNAWVAEQYNAGTPLQCCAKLKESEYLTYQLTPTQVSTLLGANNIWADAGTIEVTVASPVDLTNPTNFPAKPLIRVYGNGSVQVGDTIATVQNNADGYVDIDCESMNCYDTTGGRNADVSFSGNDFPELASGDNGILLTGPSRVEITPRWWEL